MQKIVSGLQRPGWMITSLSKIKVVIVRDRSGSVRGQKANDTQAGTNGLIEKLAAEPKAGFKVSIVDFNTTAEIICDFAYAKDLVGKVPPIVAEGYTSIGAGLEKVGELLSRTYPDDNLFTLDPVVFLWSDGQENQWDHKDVIAAGERIKKQWCATLVTIACGNESDVDLLKNLASGSQHFFRLPDVSTLRQFLPEIGVTLVHSIRHGEDVGQNLAALQGGVR